MFLGFEIDTLNMALTITFKKKENIRNIAAALLLKQSCSIRTLASFLENIFLSFETVADGKLYYRNIEPQKIEEFKTSKVNFDIKIKQLSTASLTEIKWWHNNRMYTKLSIKPTPNTVMPVNQFGELMIVLLVDRVVVQWWNTLPHKFFGTTSIWISTKSLPKWFQQKTCQDLFRQHHCSDIYK